MTADYWPKVETVEKLDAEKIEFFHVHLLDTGSIDPLAGGEYLVSLSAAEIHLIDLLIEAIDKPSLVLFRQFGSIYRIFYDYEPIKGGYERIQAKLFEAIIDEL